MPVCFTTPLSDAVRDNRWATEFHRPGYKFVAKSSENWRKIGLCSRKVQYGLSIKMNEHGRGVPIYRLNEIDNCFMSDSPTKYAPISSALAQQYRLEPNDVLFCRTNGNINYVGRTGIYKGGNTAVFASYLVKVQTNPDIVLPEYLTIYLNTRFGRKQILRRAMPSNQVNVSAAELKRIDILLLESAAQKDIAALVARAYDGRKMAIDSYTQAQQLLESELGLDNLRVDKPVGYTALFSITGLADTFDAGRIDAQCFSPEAVFYEDWLIKHAKCDRLSTLLSSAVKGHQQAEVANGSSDYCSIKHISGGEIVGASKALPGADTPSASKNDLLLAITGATIGKIGIVNRYANLVFSGDLLRLRVNSEISPHYLLLALDHHLGQVQFNRWITGSTNGHLAPRDVGRVLVPRLPAKKEEQISAFVMQSLEKRLNSEQLLEQAKARVEQLIEEAIER